MKITELLEMLNAREKSTHYFTLFEDGTGSIKRFDNDCAVLEWQNIEHMNRKLITLWNELNPNTPTTWEL
jgi:hypothetical protein